MVLWNSVQIPNASSELEDFTHGTWMSLVGLLHPYEFFVTVDQTTLWRRHVAWAKPSGEEIRDYTTQRFSSNMVFLSLLLGTNMNVLFNSSEDSTQMRAALHDQNYASLKFYIGVVLALGSCITVIGLVATFTAWGMIGAISDTNSHCLLRSSMGQYVTSLPSRFVVASLYLFLLWLILAVAECMAGPFQWLLVGVVLFLFFQVVISLSAFGRLIIHTGAMSKKRVLDPEFERYLLPSGLHASLLIKASEGSRRRTSVMTQYHGGVFKKRRNGCSRTSHVGDKTPSQKSQAMPNASPCEDVNTSLKFPNPKFLNHEGKVTVQTSADNWNETTTENTLLPPAHTSKSASPARDPNHGLHHDSSEYSTEDVDELVKHIKFPRPSFLNRTGPEELQNVVNMTLSQTNLAMENDTEPPSTPATGYELRLTNGFNEDTPEAAARKMVKRQSATFRRGAVLQMQQEWEEEASVRSMYNIDPPVEVPVQLETSRFDRNRMPRISILNRARGLVALQRLVQGGDLANDSSVIQLDLAQSNGRNPLHNIPEKKLEFLRSVSEKSKPSVVDPQTASSREVDYGYTSLENSESQDAFASPSSKQSVLANIKLLDSTSRPRDMFSFSPDEEEAGEYQEVLPDADGGERQYLLGRKARKMFQRNARKQKKSLTTKMQS
jgi:hypothetical protein